MKTGSGASCLVGERSVFITTSNLALPKLRGVPPSQVERLSFIEADGGMRAGARQVRCGAALAGYALWSWGVDCPRDLDLSGAESQLALANREALETISSSALASGRRSHAS